MPPAPPDHLTIDGCMIAGGCQAEPPQPAPPQAAPAIAQTPTAAQAAQLVWRDQVELVDPVVELAPGSRAVTGVEIELDIGGDPTVSRRFAVFGHPLRIVAGVTSYDVDWGNGQRTTGIRASDRSPDATHVYTHKGNVDVTVTARWSGSWSLAGSDDSGGPVAGQLETSATRADYPVIELQAVRTR